MEMAHTTKSLIKKNIFIVGEMVTDVLVQLEDLSFKFILKENNFRFLYSNMPLSQSIHKINMMCVYQGMFYGSHNQHEDFFVSI